MVGEKGSHLLINFYRVTSTDQTSVKFQTHT